MLKLYVSNSILIVPSSSNLNDHCTDFLPLIGRIRTKTSSIIASLIGLNPIPTLEPTGAVTVVTCCRWVSKDPKSVQV